MNKKFCPALVLVLIVSNFAMSGFAQTVSPSALKYYNSGIEKQNRQDWYGAGEDFMQALRSNEAFGEGWFHLAQVTYETGDFSLCLSYLESAEKYARNRTDILVLRGMCLISLHQLDEAEKVFNSILLEYPNNIDARFGLAEIHLYNGTYDGAENLYLDALKRQATNRKALLSLAVLSSQTGKKSQAEKYIRQALKYHASDPQVHYMAAYLAAHNKNYAEAERRARSAVQINGNYHDAYILLCSILYAQKRYQEAIDICDYLISMDRNSLSAWYLKGLSQNKLSDYDGAFSTWSVAVSIDPTDEILRSSLEQLIQKQLELEDSRRAEWAQFHILKAREYSKLFQGEEARYEYQRALRIDPNNFSGRLEFADAIQKTGLNELYVNQLSFVKDKIDPKAEGLSDTKKLEYTRLNDTYEAYTSLLKNSLARRWNVEPFYFDKTRWNIGLYYTKAPVSLIHCDTEEIAAVMAKESFSGVATTSVYVQQNPVAGYGEAFALARKNAQDYFVIMDFEESEREVFLSAVIYNGRNGTETSRFTLFRTGNDRFVSVLRSFRRNVLSVLPVRGKIIARSGNEILVDIGKTEGVVNKAVLDVVKAKNVRTVDKGVGVTFDQNSYLGQILIDETGEEIAVGTLTQRSFYDRVNIGDEVLIKSVPKAEGEETPMDTNPQATEEGKLIREKLTAEDLGLIRTPAFLELIRKVQ